MKKFLLLGTLTLTIVTSMVAGTLAKYTKTLSPIDGDVTAKIFDISADADTMENVDVRIAPNEDVDWNFKVRNYEDSSLPTEVVMDLGIEVSIPSEFIDLGVVPTLKIEGKDVTLTSTNSGSATKFVCLEEEQFKANVADEADCVLNFNWSGFSGTQDDTEKIESLTQNFTVTITGTQASN